MAWLRCPAVSERRSILLLCDDDRRHAGNVLQHIEALSTSSRHDVRRFNPVAHPAACRRLDLSEFDVVVIHYTLTVFAERYVPPVLAEKIAAYRGLKLQFVQDEYRAIDLLTATVAGLGVDVLFTCIPSPRREEVYGSRLPTTELVTTLPGLVPTELVGRTVPGVDARRVDVGYRGRRVPYWLGRLGQEKYEIGEGFAERAAAHGVTCDISSAEDTRLYGEDWHRFLSSSRATLGTESGASILDFDGRVERETLAYLARHPQAGFAEVERQVLAPYEDGIGIRVASPRLFEAAALRTVLILFHGHYSGVVEPWTHYLPLEKDFSNMGEVAEALRDRRLLEQMATAAYDDLIASGRYSLLALVAEVDRLIDERAPANAPTAKPRYRRARLRRRIPSWGNLTRVRRRLGELVMPPAATYVVARDRAVRRLAIDGRFDRGLAGDLWRLAALRRSAERNFHLNASLEDGRRLVLTSTLTPPAPNEIAEIRAGDVDEIVWNHSPVGLNIGLLRNGALDVPVGRRVPGSYRFDALVRLSRHSPGHVDAALDPLVRPDRR